MTDESAHRTSKARAEEVINAVGVACTQIAKSSPTESTKEDFWRLNEQQKGPELEFLPATYLEKSRQSPLIFRTKQPWDSIHSLDTDNQLQVMKRQ